MTERNGGRMSGSSQNRRPKPRLAANHASLGWDITDAHYVGLTIRNLADRDPPLALGSSSNVDTFNHDALGRFVTLNWISRF